MDSNAMVSLWRDLNASQLKKLLNNDPAGMPINGFIQPFINAVEAVETEDDMRRVECAIKIGFDALTAFMGRIKELSATHDTEYDGRSVDTIAHDMGLSGVRTGDGRMLYYPNAWRGGDGKKGK